MDPRRPASWFERIRSWNPLRESSHSGQYTIDEDFPSSVDMSVDLEGTSSERNGTLKRKPTVKARNYTSFIRRRGRQGVASNVGNIPLLTLSPSSPRPSFTTFADDKVEPPTSTIFDLYHPWKNEDFESSISLLPINQQSIFRDSINGGWEHLEHLLHVQCGLSPSVLEEGSTSPFFTNGSESGQYGACFVDSKGRTPLHFGAGYGHVEVVELLLGAGANPNALDASGKISPLMCAAVRGNTRIMELLISKGADVNLGLNNKSIVVTGETEGLEVHTALFWAVRGRNIEAAKCLLGHEALLASSCVDSETPLHEAAYIGDPALLKLLVENERNLISLCLRGGESKNTPLHIAVENGHMSCAETLLYKSPDPNKGNADGETALHLAAKSVDIDMVQLILGFDCDVNASDGRRRTAMHHCINFTKTGNCTEALQCVELLLENGIDINSKDENGMTHFHAAVENGNSSIVQLLLKRGANLGTCNNSGQSGVELLVKKMPYAVRFIRENLDFAINVKSQNRKDIMNPECEIQLNFQPLVSNFGPGSTDEDNNETDLLLSFCDFGHNDILSHPLIEAFLILKWKKVMIYFWASFAANLLLVVTFSCFVVYSYEMRCPLSGLRIKNRTNLTNEANLLRGIETSGLPTSYLAVWCSLIVMLVVFLVKELVQLIATPKAYFKLNENSAQLLFVTLAGLTIAPVFRAGTGKLCERLNYWDYRWASLSVLVAWFLILLRIGKLPKLGLYVQMFFKVWGNFGMFIITYGCVVIAFALAFVILLEEVKAFRPFFLTLLSTVVMAIGEINVGDFVDILPKVGSDDPPLPWLTYFILIAFVFLVTIVLMNLLVGLAVSDIQGLTQGAKVARLSRLIVAISQLESMLFSNPLTKVVPHSLLSRLRRGALLMPSRGRGSRKHDNRYRINIRPHDPRDRSLPRKLKLDIVQLLEDRKHEKLFTMTHANTINRRTELFDPSVTRTILFNNSPSDCDTTTTNLNGLYERLDRIEYSLARIQRVFGSK